MSESKPRFSSNKVVDAEGESVPQPRRLAPLKVAQPVWTGVAFGSPTVQEKSPTQPKEKVASSVGIALLPKAMSPPPTKAPAVSIFENNSVVEVKEAEEDSPDARQDLLFERFSVATTALFMSMPLIIVVVVYHMKYITTTIPILLLLTVGHFGLVRFLAHKTLARQGEEDDEERELEVSTAELLEQERTTHKSRSLFQLCKLGAGHWTWDVGQGFVSVLGCVLFFVQNPYLDLTDCPEGGLQCLDSDRMEHPTYIWVMSGSLRTSWDVLEISTAWLVSLDYLTRLRVTDNYRNFLSDFSNIIDIGFYISAAFAAMLDTHVLAGQWPFSLFLLLGPLRFLRLHRLTALLEHVPPVMRVGPLVVSQQSFRIAVLLLRLISIVCQASILVMVAEYPCPFLMQDCQVDDCRDKCLYEMREFSSVLYFIFVTFATVGYGDLSARTLAGRYVVMGMIVYAIVVVPKELSRFESAVGSSFSGAYQNKSGEAHVIVISNRFSEVSALAREIVVNERPGGIRSKVVVLSSTDPSGAATQLARENELITNRVVFLSGSALSDTDLRRADVVHAEAVLILPSIQASTEGASPLELGLQEMLSVAAINKVTGGTVPIVAKCLLAEDRRKIQHAGAQTVFCVEDFKSNILGLACVCPGAMALVLNLIISDPVMPSLPEDQDKRWREEYCQGMKLEVYQADISLYVDKTFAQAVRLAYVKYGAILIGLKQWDPVTGEEKCVLLPSDRIIHRGDIGFILSNEDTIIDKLLMESESRGTRSILGASRHSVRNRLTSIAKGNRNMKAVAKASQAFAKTKRPPPHLGTTTPRPAPSAPVTPTQGNSERDLLSPPADSAALDAVRSPESPSASRVKLPDSLPPLPPTAPSAIDKAEKLKAKITTAATGSGTTPAASGSNKKKAARADAAAPPPKDYFCNVPRCRCTCHSKNGGRGDDFTFLRDHLLFTSAEKNVPSIIERVRTDPGAFASLNKRWGDQAAVWRDLRATTVRVVVIYDKNSDIAVLDELHQMPDVSLLRGDPTKEADIIKAGVRGAASVLIIQSLMADKDGHHNDHRVLKTFLSVSSATNGRASVLLELVDAESVSWIDRSKFTDIHFANLFTEGRIFNSFLSESFLRPILISSGFLDLLQKLILPPVDQRCPRLVQIPIPEHMYGKPFEDLFKWLALQNVIALGLYRIARNGPARFAFTAPDKGTILNDTDRVFALASNQTLVAVTSQGALAPSSPKDSDGVSDAGSAKNTRWGFLRKLSASPTP